MLQEPEQEIRKRKSTGAGEPFEQMDQTPVETVKIIEEKPLDEYEGYQGTGLQKGVLYGGRPTGSQGTYGQSHGAGQDMTISEEYKERLRIHPEWTEIRTPDQKLIITPPVDSEVVSERSKSSLEQPGLLESVKVGAKGIIGSIFPTAHSQGLDNNDKDHAEGQSFQGTHRQANKTLSNLEAAAVAELEQGAMLQSGMVAPMELTQPTTPASDPAIAPVLQAADEQKVDKFGTEGRHRLSHGLHHLKERLFRHSHAMGLGDEYGATSVGDAQPTRTNESSRVAAVEDKLDHKEGSLGDKVQAVLHHPRILGGVEGADGGEIRTVDQGEYNAPAAKSQAQAEQAAHAVREHEGLQGVGTGKPSASEYGVPEPASRARAPGIGSRVMEEVSAVGESIKESVTGIFHKK